MSTPARKRLMRDFKRLQQDPPAGISGAPQDNNIMLWNAVIFGPDDTPWDEGLDVGAREKQGNPKVDDGFKVPKEKITCIATSVDVDEEFESSGVEETRSTVTNGSRSHSNRRYRDKTANLTTNSDIEGVVEDSISSSWKSQSLALQVGVLFNFPFHGRLS
ncbi:hypothetical protein ERO13_D12G178188v2 [Gossypium hirsutum]|nr:uncharacterized protein LOC107946493 isoform X2 [Gossypium hirsutum]KAG4116569.1 hypothetical protein ERO13_D12G178188v2 [Gossypium hirsutum]PPD74350.1 hypothetical protein GOBAR_DD28729 [Gossypium barbadense]